MKRPPLRQIADLAHVSVPTVSRVINGREGVAEPTRQRVVDILEAHGFSEIPTPSKTRKNVVAIVSGEFTNPVFPTTVDQLSRYLSQEGFLPTTLVPDAAVNTEERCVQEILASNADAAIFIGGSHAQAGAPLDVYTPLLDREVPLIFINGATTDLPVIHLRCDEASGSQQAVRHLLSLGHRSIGCVVGGRHYVPTQRLVSGYLQAMTEAHLHPDPDDIAETSFTLEGGRAAGRRLLERGVTGIVTSNDLMALGVVSAARALGLDVPTDVSVVGYDGTDFTAYTDPPLTTLRQPFADMAQLVVTALNSALDHGSSFEDPFIFEPRLVVRGSSGTLGALDGVGAR